MRQWQNFREHERVTEAATELSPATNNLPAVAPSLFSSTMVALMSEGKDEPAPNPRLSIVQATTGLAFEPRPPALFRRSFLK